MMYEINYIRALAHSARVPVARYMRPDTVNGTDKRMGHAQMRAILFARALSHHILRAQFSESFQMICMCRLGERESKCMVQLSISSAQREIRWQAPGS